MKILNRFTGELLLEVESLRGAYLHGANLGEADLRGADLRVAYLHGCDLRGANLSNCIGNRKEIKSIFISETYPITYTSEVMQIACENHPIEDWWNFDDKRILQMDGKTALKFWRKHKDLIKQIIETCPAIPTGYENENN